MTDAIKTIDVNQAIEALETDLVRRDATVKAIEVLREVQAAQGLAQSLTRQAETTAAGLDKALADLAAAKEGVSAADAEAVAILERAQSAAQAVVDQAQHNANDVAEKARKDAAAAVEEAKAGAEKALALTTAQRDGLARECTELRAESETLTATRDSLKAEVEERERALARVKAAIAEARA